MITKTTLANCGSGLDRGANVSVMETTVCSFPKYDRELLDFIFLVVLQLLLH